MPKLSFAQTVAELQETADAVRSNAGILPSFLLGGADEIEAQIAEMKELKGLQRAYAAELKATIEAKRIAMARGIETARYMRDAIRYLYGRKNARIGQFGIRLRRRPRRKAGPISKPLPRRQKPRRPRRGRLRPRGRSVRRLGRRSRGLGERARRLGETVRRLGGRPRTVGRRARRRGRPARLLGRERPTIGESVARPGESFRQMGEKPRRIAWPRPSTETGQERGLSSVACPDRYTCASVSASTVRSSRHGLCPAFTNSLHFTNRRQ
jgi:hypothetical protein